MVSICFWSVGDFGSQFKDGGPPASTSPPMVSVAIPPSMVSVKECVAQCAESGDSCKAFPDAASFT